MHVYMPQNCPGCAEYWFREGEEVRSIVATPYGFSVHVALRMGRPEDGSFYRMELKANKLTSVFQELFALAEDQVVTAGSPPISHSLDVEVIGFTDKVPNVRFGSKVFSLGVIIDGLSIDYLGNVNDKR